MGRMPSERRGADAEAQRGQPSHRRRAYLMEAQRCLMNRNGTRALDHHAISRGLKKIVGTLQGLSPFRKHLAPFRAVSLMSDCTATSYIKSSVRRCPQPYQDALVRLLWPSHVPALPSGPDSLRLPTGSMREQLGPRCGRRGFLSCSTCNLRGWEV